MHRALKICGRHFGIETVHASVETALLPYIGQIPGFNKICI